MEAVNASTELAVAEVNRPPQSFFVFSFDPFNPLPILHLSNSDMKPVESESVEILRPAICDPRSDQPLALLSRRSRNLRAFKRMNPSASP
jgi:hypothetical protein